MVREGIVSSEAVNSLAWAEEVFYRRLFSVVDDFGRYHGNPKLIRAACYPLQLNKVSDQDITKWLAATQKAGLVRVYQVEGKSYIEVLKFGQQIRAKKSKFPECTADATQMLSTCVADAHLVVVEDEVDISAARFDDFWAVYPRKVAKPKALKAWKALRPDDALADRMIRVVQTTAWSPDPKFIPHPSTWLNERRWEDVSESPVSLVKRAAF